MFPAMALRRAWPAALRSVLILVLIIGPRHLYAVLDDYVSRYNEHLVVSTRSHFRVARPMGSLTGPLR